MTIFGDSLYAISEYLRNILNPLLYISLIEHIIKYGQSNEKN